VLSDVKRSVERWAAESGRSDVRTDRVVCLDVTNRAIDGYCYLFFAEGHETPAVVAKAARTAAGREVFEIEQRNLETLERIGMNDGARRTPAPLGRFEIGETLITLQSGLVGTLMKNLPGRSLFAEARAEATLRRVTDWSNLLRARFGVEHLRLDDARYAEVVLRPVERFLARYRVDPRERKFLLDRFGPAASLRGAELPFMARHGDFCAANIVLDRDEIAVFDWEFPLRHETPLFDLFFFYASVRFPYVGPRGESDHFRSFVAVYWEDSYFSRIVRRLLDEACTATGVPRELTADLFLLALIQIANMKYDGLADSHGLSPVPETEQDKLARWSSFTDPDKNAPFACIEDGTFRNLNHVVAHGLPVF